MNVNKSYRVTDENGSVFLDKYCIPEEVISIVLSHVPPRDLVFTCRQVCKFWCNVVDRQVWRIIFGRERKVSPSRVREIPWFACYWMVLKNPFDRNLVKNGCGQDGLNHWKLITNEGDHWIVEKAPKGCGDLPDDPENEEIKSYASCFATTYNSCSKEQIIDLKKEGAVPQIMDFLQPEITVSEWYCGRSDSRCIYEFKTAILDEHQNLIEDYEVRKILDKPEGALWQKVSHTFEKYGKGVRYLWIYHYGQDLMFWKGHYGSKVTGSSAVLNLRNL